MMSLIDDESELVWPKYLGVGRPLTIHLNYTIHAFLIFLLFFSSPDDSPADSDAFLNYFSSRNGTYR